MSDIGDYSIGNMLSVVPEAAGSYMKANPELIKGLALAGKMASIAGAPRMSNQADTRATDLGNAVAQYAAGSSIPKQPALQAPPVAPQNTQAAQVTNPADLDKNGTVSPQEAQQATISFKGQGAHSIASKLMSGYTAPEYKPGDVGKSLQDTVPFLLAKPDFQDSISAPAGMPNAVSSVPVVQPAPFVQNLNTAGVLPNGLTQEQQRFQSLAGLVGFDNALKVAQQDSVTQGANTNALEAGIKAARLPADINNLNATAAHSAMQATDLNNKMHSIYNYDPDAVQKIALATELGKKQAEQGSIVDFADTELGKMPLPAELQKLQPGAKTYGDVAVLNGSMSGVHKLMELYNSRVVADINKSGNIGAADKMKQAAQIAALGQITTSLDQEQRSISTQLTAREAPSFKWGKTPEQQATDLVATNELKKNYAYNKDMLSKVRQTQGLLGQISGEQTPPKEPTTTTKSYARIATAVPGFTKKVPAGMYYWIEPDGLHVSKEK